MCMLPEDTIVCFILLNTNASLIRLNFMSSGEINIFVGICLIMKQ